MAGTGGLPTIEDLEYEERFDKDREEPVEFAIDAELDLVVAR